jgi:hypothetical protein
MSDCYKIFGAVHPRIEGWRLVNVECNIPKDVVNLTWNRIYGTIDDLRREENRGSWVSRMNTALETVSFPFRHQTVYSDDLAPLDLESVGFLGFFQKINNPVQIQSSGILDGNTLSTIGREDWQGMFDLYPGTLRSISGKGVSLTNITYYVQQNKWLIKGGIYYAKF